MINKEELFIPKLSTLLLNGCVILSLGYVVVIALNLLMIERSYKLIFIISLIVIVFLLVVLLVRILFVQIIRIEINHIILRRWENGLHPFTGNKVLEEFKFPKYVEGRIQYSAIENVILCNAKRMLVSAEEKNNIKLKGQLQAPPMDSEKYHANSCCEDSWRGRICD